MTAGRTQERPLSRSAVPCSLSFSVIISTLWSSFLVDFLHRRPPTQHAELLHSLCWLEGNRNVASYHSLVIADNPSSRGTPKLYSALLVLKVPQQVFLNGLFYLPNYLCHMGIKRSARQTIPQSVSVWMLDCMASASKILAVGVKHNCVKIMYARK